jgi:hypothetical protein
MLSECENTSLDFSKNSRSIPISLICTSYFHYFLSHTVCKALVLQWGQSNLRIWDVRSTDTWKLQRNCSVNRKKPQECQKYTISDPSSKMFWWRDIPLSIPITRYPSITKITKISAFLWYLNVHGWFKAREAMVAGSLSRFFWFPCDFWHYEGITRMSKLFSWKEGLARFLKGILTATSTWSFWRLWRDWVEWWPRSFGFFMEWTEYESEGPAGFNETFWCWGRRDGYVEKFSKEKSDRQNVWEESWLWCRI